MRREGKGIRGVRSVEGWAEEEKEEGEGEGEAQHWGACWGRCSGSKAWNRAMTKTPVMRRALATGKWLR